MQRDVNWGGAWRMGGQVSEVGGVTDAKVQPCACSHLCAALNKRLKKALFKSISSVLLFQMRREHNIKRLCASLEILLDSPLCCSAALRACFMGTQSVFGVALFTCETGLSFSRVCTQAVVAVPILSHSTPNNSPWRGKYK